MPDNGLSIAFVPIARPTFDTVLAAEMASAARAQLGDAGYRIGGPETPLMEEGGVQGAIEALRGRAVDLLVIFQASFADSSVAQALARGITAPVLLWAVPEPHTGGRLRLNSFCGINLGGHALRRVGVRYAHLYAPPGDPAVLAKVATQARAGKVLRLLKGLRIGRVGEHPGGFEPCGYDAPALAQRFGVEVVPVDLSSFFSLVREQPLAQVEALRGELSGRVAGLDSLDLAATQGTLGVYRTLEQMAAAERLGGIAVRCWPEFFTELGCAACGALSLLTDDGVPCSCEADVNGTITEALLHFLSGEAAFGTDIVSADAARDAAVVWHCGLAPLSLADPETQPRGTMHSNRKLPLLMEFPLKPGRVTVARLSEASGEYRLVVGGGEMLRAPMAFSGTSGVLHFDRPVADVFDTILDEGLEHHVAITYGDYVPELLALAEMLGMPVLRLS